MSFRHIYSKLHCSHCYIQGFNREINFIGTNQAPVVQRLDNATGLKVNDQLVAYATRFLAVRLKKYVWSHHRALKAKVQYDFSSAYSPDNTN